MNVKTNANVFSEPINYKRKFPFKIPLMTIKGGYHFYKLKEKYQVDDMSKCITDVERCTMRCHNEDIEEIDKIYKDFVNTQWMYKKNNEDLNTENDTEKKL